MDNLAIFGGTPASAEPIYYGRQAIDEQDIEAVVDVLRSDYLTTGPKINELEHRLCEVAQSVYSCAVCNGTAALHAAAFAIDIQPGDEVIVPAITFAATANSIVYCGGTPIFADIDPDTYNISVDSIKSLITPKTKAIFAVDFTGQVVDADAIRKLCDEHNLFFVEDAAHSIGSKYNGRPVGSLADLTTFSFHPVKTVTSGEGGSVQTNNPELYKRLMLFRTHGITRDPALLKTTQNSSWYYEQQLLGYNYRLTDIQAALLLSQLSKLNQFVARRKEIVDTYNRAFSAMEHLQIQQEIAQSDSARHLYILKLLPEKILASRDEIFEALAAENVFCNLHYIPVYKHPYYQNNGYANICCPNSESLYENMLTIPLHCCLSNQNVQDVITAVKKVINHYKK